MSNDFWALAGKLVLGAIAVISFLVTFLSWRRQMAADDRASAELVTAWTVSAELRDRALKDCIVLRNAGSSPIFDVSMDALCGSGNLRPAPTVVDAWHTIPPGTYLITWTLNPKWGHVWGLPELISDEGLHGYVPWTIQRNHAITRLTFTDAAGRAWERDDHGRLSEQSSRRLPWSRPATPGRPALPDSGAPAGERKAS